MSGDVFESYCHIILNFSTGIEFDFVPMVRIGGHPTVGEKRMAQWSSSHTEFSGSVQSQALEVLCASSLASGASPGVHPPRVFDLDSNVTSMYIPIKPIRAGIDSFILQTRPSTSSR